MCKIDYYTLWRSYMKKFALVLIAAILAISLVACTGDETDENSGSVSDYMQTSHEYEVSITDANGKKVVLGTLSFEDGSGNTAIISDYIGIHKSHEVKIPTKVGPENAERDVTAIGKEAFYYCTSITTVIIPEGVTSIGDYAFAGCTSLESITVPASVTSIGKGAFNGCTALKEIKFADGSQLTSIGDYIFNDCSALAAISLPEGLKTIGVEAFRDCAALTSFKTPASLDTIGDMAFYNCEGLNASGALDLSASGEISAIGEFAFKGINKYYITVPADANSEAAKYVAAMEEPEETEEETEETMKN